MAKSINFRRLRALFVLGTRPEIVKLAPVIRECARRSQDIQAVVCATGQHRELSQQAQADFELNVDYDLRAMRTRQSLAELLSKCLKGADRTIAQVRPDCVIAQGDTSSVVIAAMSAFFRQIPFIHVEAGLRTHNLSAPWPEEWNRRMATLSAAIHCAPTWKAAENLRAEGIAPAAIHVTGNTIVDALHWTLSRVPDAVPPCTRVSGRFVLITAHRRENFGKPLSRICQAIAAAAKGNRDVTFVFPIHPNPRVRTTVERVLSGLPNVLLLPPLGHGDFVHLLARCCLVLTDSGGVQEEACSLGKPMLILREETERPEVLSAERTRLVGTDRRRLQQEIETELAAEDAVYSSVSANPFGDGHASRRIVDLLLTLSPTSD